MNYSQFVQIVAGLLVPSTLQTAGAPTDPDFTTELPDAISYAELRMQRDLDFLQTRLSQYQNSGPVNLTLTTHNRNLSLNSLLNPIVVLEQVNVITPSGASSPDAGTRNPLTRHTKPYLDLVFPSSVGSTTPTTYAMTDAGDIIVGPWPDASYLVEVYGTTRFTPLSASNTSNWLSVWMPDLYVAAAMIRLVGWRKDYASAGSDDPQAGGYWESQYAALLSGSQVEEARRMAQSAGWGSQKPRAESRPPRR